MCTFMCTRGTRQGGKREFQPDNQASTFDVGTQEEEVRAHGHKISEKFHRANHKRNNTTQRQTSSNGPQAHKQRVHSGAHI